MEASRPEVMGEAPPSRRSPWVRRAAIAAGVALAVVAGPRLLDSAGLSLSAPPPVRPATPSAAASTPAPAPLLAAPTPDYAATVLRWAPRGDLAGDRGFLGDVLALARRSSGGARTVVLWAGRERDGRLALVGRRQGIDGRPAVIAVSAVHVPAGTPAASARPRHLGFLAEPGSAVVRLGRTPGGWALLALGAPSGVTVEYSTDVDYRTDRPAGRRWVRLAGAGGVARASGPPSGLGFLAVRVPGTGPHDRLAVQVLPDGPRDPRPPAVQTPTAAYAGPQLAGLPGRLAAAWGPLAAHARVVWSGRHDAARLALLEVRTRGGATFQAWVGEGPDAGPGSGLRPLPAGQARTRPWVVPAGSSGALLLNPAGAGTVRVSGSGVGRTLRVPSSGVVALPPGTVEDGARLVVRDARGRTVSDAPVRVPGEADPLALAGR